MGIITSLEELKQSVEITSGLKLPTIQPSIDRAESKNLKACLGNPLYDSLQAAYTAAGNQVNAMEGDLKDLAILSQRAVSNIAMSLLITRISVQVGDSGILRNETEKQKTAFQYQEVNLREDYLNTGFDALDDILEFLEAKQSAFPEWLESPAHTDYTKYFIQSANQFSECYNIRQSRLAFYAVRYIMKRIEDFMVKDILGKKLFNSLKLEIKSKSVSENNQLLLDDYIRPGVALITISKGVWERALDISEHGVTVSVKGSTDNNQLRNEAALEKQQKMADHLMADGNEYFSRLSKHLYDNQDDYPDYEIPVTGSTLFTINNSLDKGIYTV